MSYQRSSADPFQLEELRRQMDRFLEHVTHRHSFMGEYAPEQWQPRVDVYETPQAVVVLVELAGMSPQDIQLAVRGRTLTLAGVRQPRVRTSPCQIDRLEIPWGQFQVRVELPGAVNDAHAEAEYADGLLEIVLPRAVPVHPVIAAPGGMARGRT